MINILIIGMMDVRGGVEQLIYEMFQCLDPNKIHCDFLCYCNKCVYEDEFKAAGSNVYHITRRGENPLKCRKELKAFFKTQGDHYDYIWIHTSSASNCMGHIFAKRYTNARIISHSHGTHFESKKGLIHAIHTFLHRYHQKKFVRCTDFYFACSRAAGEWLYGSDLKDLKVIKNGIDPDKYQFDPVVRERIRESFSLENKKVIGHAGRFCTVKNQSFLLEIFSSIAGQSDDYLLLLAGEGELLGLMKQKAADLGIADKVIFAGYRQDLNCILQAVDIFILPSLYEGLPIVAIEAQGSGLPCLLTDTITKEVSISDLVSYMSLTKSAQQWAEKITTLLKIYENNNRSIYRRIISENGYDINETVKELEQFLMKHKGAVMEESHEKNE